MCIRIFYLPIFRRLEGVGGEIYHPQVLKVPIIVFRGRKKMSMRVN